MSENSGVQLDDLLNQALDRQYSGSPGEIFFTGGGRHVFANFDDSENGLTFTLREGLQHSVNLVYTRLMRDLVRFHRARFAYDPDSLLNDVEHPQRKKMLHEIADEESRQFLFQAYKRFNHKSAEAVIETVAGAPTTARRLAIFFLSWNDNTDAETLAQWISLQGNKSVSLDEARRFLKAYDQTRLNIADFGYLLDRHPLEVWCAGELLKNPGMSWNELLGNSTAARDTAFRWLFQSKNRRAQDLRLRIRFEQDAFARILPYWRQLGFPFDHLVPSLATAIGSSADRHAALAQLMGIILNDGLLLPTVRMQQLRFAAGTPYETRR